ncbi:MAG: hypothetical protein Q8L81_02965 [Bacteroidota bacterium]|nr:hypothetical protein [Bacteroidota bacterium]
MNSITEIKGLSNQEFIEKYAKQGCVGLVGGTHFIDKSIKKYQKKITSNGKESLWSHAFIFNEIRQDKKWWVIESDLEFYKKQMRVGVQENRADKYFDKALFSHIAILDFNLSKEDTNKVIAEALNLVAIRTEYSIREIFGVLFSLTGKNRSTENLLAQENSLFCSAFVQHCYNCINIDFNTAVSTKHLTPEEIFATKQKCSITVLM